MANHFHHADMEKSARLQGFRKAIKQAGKRGMTGAELWRECGCLNPGTTASEINACLAKSESAYRIVCEYQGRKANGAKIYRYFYRRG